MILLLDNYDSFTYNIAHALGAMGEELTIVRNDAIDVNGIRSLNPAAVVISPGPGGPADAGISCSVVEAFAGSTPILGVCLGHQCIAHVFGAHVVRADVLVHGKTSDIFHDGRTIYSGLRNPFSATRYHSLIVDEDSVRAPLEVSAYTVDGEVMGLRYPGMKIEGVQFHPESIATPQGTMILRNFLETYVRMQSAA